MKDMNFSDVVESSIKVRKLYHKLEKQYHGKEWTVEEDALAFLADAGLVHASARALYDILFYTILFCVKLKKYGNYDIIS
ncbi:hypothetical protein CDLVIII_2100 [Clostridium sp. DL-VIII]|nr:hypothetical protein CDLVIII_2100 [Clostridium sp. DL-VIII]